MKNLVIVLLFFSKANAQQYFSAYTLLKDSLKIGKGEADFLPFDKKGYQLILPKKTIPFKGTIVTLEDAPVSGKDTLENQLFQNTALENGYALLHVATGIPVDLFFDQKSLHSADTLLQSIFKIYKMPNKKIVLLGVMTNGHRALKYTIYHKQGRSTFKPDIKAIILCESAIDWVRQWYEGQKQVRDHLSEVGFFEGNLVTYLFKTNLHATPVNAIRKYLDFSAYSYFDTKQRYIPLFKDIAVRTYSYADSNYWFGAKGKGILDCNFPDMQGFINELKLAGNTKSELIAFTNTEKNNPDKMQSQSATWSFVDKINLIEWINAQIAENQ